MAIGEGRGVRWWLRFAVDPKSIAAAKASAAQALGEGTRPERPVSNLRRIERGFDRIKGAVFSLKGAIAGLGLTLGFAQVLRFLVSTNREYEKFIARLHTFEGSAEAARAAFARMEALASRTPFQIEDLVNAFATLRSAGIQPTDEDLIAFGDTASAAAGNIADMAMAIRQAAVGETERLKAFNISARINGEQITLTYDNISKTVGRNAREIAQAVREIGEERFAGAMEREMLTLNGAISNLQDNLGTIARTVGQGGLTGELRGMVGQFRDWTGEIAENKSEVMRWTAIVMTSIRAVLSTAATLIRVPFNVGQIIGDSIVGVFFVLRGAVQKVLNDIGDHVNGLIVAANLLPGVDIQWRFNGRDPEEFMEGYRDAQERTRRNTLQIADALKGTASAWASVGRAAASSAEVQVASAAAAKDAAEDAAAAAARSAALAARLKAGDLPTQDLAQGFTGVRRADTATGRGGGMETGGPFGLRGPEIIGPVSDVQTTFTTMGDVGESQAERLTRIFTGLERIAVDSSFGISSAFTDAFEIMAEEGTDAGDVITALARGIGNTMLGAIAQWAQGKATQNFVQAAEDVALALTMAATPGMQGFSGPLLAAAAKHVAVGTAWAALAGGAGMRFGSSAAGGGAGGAAGTQDTGSRRGEAMRRQDTEINVYLDPLDPYNPAVAEIVYVAGGQAEQRFGTGAKVNVRPGVRRGG